MSGGKPLEVRVAKRLGCRPRLNENGFWYECGCWTCFCSPDGKRYCTCAASSECGAQHSGIGSVALAPYGEDSAAGWACTGPLIPRFKLSLVAAEDGYFCSDAELEREVKAPTACAAVAEWVAKYAPPQPGDGA